MKFKSSDGGLASSLCQALRRAGRRPDLGAARVFVGRRPPHPGLVTRSRPLPLPSTGLCCCKFLPGGSSPRLQIFPRSAPRARYAKCVPCVRRATRVSRLRHFPAALLTPSSKCQRFMKHFFRVSAILDNCFKGFEAIVTTI